MRPIALVAALICLGVVAGCDDGVRVHGNGPAETCADVRPFDPDGCDGLSRYVRTAGLLNTDGVAGGVFAAEGLVYVADGDNGLLVVDACNPARMSVRGRVRTPGSATDVAVAGRYAYVACAGSGLAVVDVNDPRLPVVVGTARGAGLALDIDVVGTHAYVADDAVGLIVYDVSNPFRPVLAGVENTPGQARGVRVLGPVAYVADAVLGLRIVSVVDPANPWLVKSVRTPGDATDVDVVGDFAYVADGVAGLTIIDVSSIPDAAVLGRLDTVDRANDVRVSDGVAFLLDKTDDLLVVDVSRPDAPFLITEQRGAGAATAVALSRDYAYLASGSGGLRVVDVRTPQAPPVLSEVTPGGSRAVALVTDGATVYVADDDFGLYIDEWQAGQLAPRGSLAFPGGTNNAFLYEGFLYVSGTIDGVYVVDVADVDRPVIVGAIPGTASSIDIALADSVSFTVRSRGLSPSAYDLRTRETPQTIPITDVLTAVDVGREFAYFVSVQGTLYVSTLVPPVAVVRSMATGGRASDLVVRDDGSGGEVLCVALETGAVDAGSGIAGSPGVEVYSLADPKIPELRYVIETSIPAQRVAFAGSYLYVAGGSDGLEVFDITDPMAPIPAGYYWRAQPVNDVGVVPGAIVAAAGPAGLLALPLPCVAR